MHGFNVTDGPSVCLQLVCDRFPILGHVERMRDQSAGLQLKTYRSLELAVGVLNIG